MDLGRSRLRRPCDRSFFPWASPDFETERSRGLAGQMDRKEMAGPTHIRGLPKCRTHKLAVLMPGETFEKAVWLPLRSLLVVGSEGEEVPNEPFELTGCFQVDRLMRVV